MPSIVSMKSPRRPETLEIIVIGGSNMKDNNWILRQLPYILLSYAGRQLRTSCLTNGGRNPRFNKKLKIGIVDGFHAIAITAWSKNMFSPDSFIGSGKIDITKALKDGFDDLTCTLLGMSGRDVGTVKLIVHFSNPEKYGRASSAVALQDISGSLRPQDEPSPLPPTTGYPPPSPYHPYYPPSPLHFAASTSAVAPNPPPSAPYPPPADPSLSYNAPPFQMPGYHPSVHDINVNAAPKDERCGAPEPK